MEEQAVESYSLSRSYLPLLHLGWEAFEDVLVAALELVVESKDVPLVI